MIKIKANNDKINKSRLESFQTEIGNRLPVDYFNFLIKTNGGEPEPNIVAINQYGPLGVNMFFGLDTVLSNDIKYILIIYKDRIPESYLPIAGAEGGNLICISLKNNDVYFWDHDIETSEKEKANLKNMFKLSDSFSAFLNDLGQLNPVKVEVKQEAVNSVPAAPGPAKEIKKVKK